MWGEFWGVGDCLKSGSVKVAVEECWSDEGVIWWGLT